MFTFAQDETSPTCDDPAALATGYSEALATAATLEDLQVVQAQMASDLAACQGLVFEGNKDTVYGPLEIPAGIYKAVFTVEDNGIVNLTKLDGECEIPLGGSLFASISGAAAEGAETVFRSEGCELLIETKGIRSPYTLEFQSLQ